MLTDIGTLGGISSGGAAINDAGQITGGAATSSGAYHAFLYSNGVMTDLGTLPGGTYSQGLAINNVGQITGYFLTASGTDHAFLYSSGVMMDLNSLIDPNLHITLTGAYGINDHGQIVAGDYDSSSNAAHAYLLTPVPEPGTWALLGAGLLLVAALARSYKSVSGNER